MCAACSVAVGSRNYYLLLATGVRHGQALNLGSFDFEASATTTELLRYLEVL